MEAVDYVDMREINLDGQVQVMVETASEAEAQQLRTMFPGATASPIETADNHNCYVVVHPRASTPDDQLKAALRRTGVIKSIKDLAPSRQLARANATPLKLAVFCSQEDAASLIKKGYILVRGERLTCRSFRVGGPIDNPATQAPEPRHLAWLFGIPAGYKGVDMERISEQHGGTRWYARRARDGRQAMEIQFPDEATRNTAIGTSVLLGSRPARWTLSPPCLDCGAEGHVIADCPQAAAMPQPAPKAAPATKKPRTFAGIVESDDRMMAAITEAVAKATAPLQETIAKQQAMIDSLMRRLAMIPEDTEDKAMEQVTATATPAQETEDVAMDDANDAAAMETTVPPPNAGSPTNGKPPKRNAAVQAEATIRVAATGQTILC